MPHGGACGPQGGWRGASTNGLVPGGGAPLVPPVPSRGRCVELLGPPPGCGARGRRVVGGPCCVVGAVPRRRERCCCLPDLVMVVPPNCPSGVPMLEDLYFRCGRGYVHCFPADELDGADHGVGLWGAHVRRTWWMSSAVGSCWGRPVPPGPGLERAVLQGAGAGRRSAHGCDQDVFCQPFHHEEVFPFQVSGSNGLGL